MIEEITDKLREQVAELPPLFSTKEINPSRLKEKESARDRMILYLVTQGLSNQEIAARLNISTATVCNTKAQPSFKENAATLVHTMAKEEIEELLQRRSVEALEVATSMMRHAAKEEVRARSAFEILKLAIGTKVTVQNKEIPVSQIDEEIRRKQELIGALERTTATKT